VPTIDAKPDVYKGKILVLLGVDDPVVPDEQTLAFWKEMRDAKANWEFVAYGKALHTLTNWLMTAHRLRSTTNRPTGGPGSPCKISSRKFLREIGPT
jgi:dienelactone hydrolase